MTAIAASLAASARVGRIDPTFDKVVVLLPFVGSATLSAAMASRALLSARLHSPVFQPLRTDMASARRASPTVVPYEAGIAVPSDRTTIRVRMTEERCLVPRSPQRVAPRRA